MKDAKGGKKTEKYTQVNFRKKLHHLNNIGKHILVIRENIGGGQKTIPLHI